MRVFTVHLPPADGRGSQASRAVFVRDGFSFWALLFPMLWFLVNRMWLVLLGYLALTAAIVAGSTFLPGIETPIGVASLMVNLLIGFEANGLRRWSLDRKRWSFVAVVTGRDLAEAEQRYFSSLAGDDLDRLTAFVDPDALFPSAPPRPPVQSPPPAWGSAKPAPPVTGLFPEPGR